MNERAKLFVYRFIAFSCVLYVVLYLLSAFLFDRHLVGLEQNRSAILQALKQRVPNRVSAFLKERPPSFIGEPPRFTRPLQVIPLLLTVTQHHETLETELKTLLTSFKTQLFKMDLTGLALSRESIDFGGANFHQSTLRKVILEGVNFRQANLTEVDLGEARLRDTLFTGATLNKANLSNIDLRNADLKQVDFRGANFFYADLTAADLSGSNLSGVKMSGGDFRKVSFKGANLSRVTLGGARLDGADFSDASLEGADLRYADLSQSTGLSQVQLENVLMDHNTSLPEGF